MRPSQPFAKSLFHGVLSEGSLFPFPSLSVRESGAVESTLNGVRKFCEANVDSAAIDEACTIPENVIAGMRSLGLFGLAIPEVLGGAGLSFAATTRIIQEVGHFDASLATTLSAHSGLATQSILRFAEETTRAALLPKLASGATIGAFALAEGVAGSDTAGIQTRADAETSKGDVDYVIRGTKLWVTNASMANLFTVFARTSPANEGHKPKTTAFVVMRGETVRVLENPRKLGLRGASTPEVVFDGARADRSHVLGEVGRGLRVAMESLNTLRLFSAGAMVGQATALIDHSVSRARERRAFGRPLIEFGLIKDKIASMMAETYALESLTYLTCGLIDSGAEDFSVECAICKVFGSEMLVRVANDALQIAAGVGSLESQPYARAVRDSRMQLIFGGTNEILRCFIALSGMQSPGRALSEVATSMREPIKGFGLLSDFALRKAKSALSRERLTKHSPLVSREAQMLESFSADLSRAVDKVLRKHGKNIAEMQYTQRRAADIAIDLLTLAAVVSRTSRAIERRGEEGSRREIDLTTIFANSAEKRLSENVAAFDRNDDELRKAVASRAAIDGGYPLDVM